MSTDAFADHLINSRTALLRTARARLHNAHWAEDAVSETLLAALEKPPPFDEAARVTAWLFGILRHKLVDQLRRHTGYDGLDDVAELHDVSPFFDPAHRCGDAQFVAALTRQLEQLPKVQARAFALREAVGLEAADICADLGVSTSHVWVLLHRARLRLRKGLESFAPRPG